MLTGFRPAIVTAVMLVVTACLKAATRSPVTAGPDSLCTSPIG